MTVVAGALLPVFGLIVAGYILRNSGWLDEGFWLNAERLTYFILFPALLFSTVSRADLTAGYWPMFGALFTAILVIAVIIALSAGILRRATGASPATFTSMFQGAIRPNTYIATATAAGLYGTPGLTFAAVGIAAAVPLVNVLSVTVLARHMAGGSARLLLRQLARNPIIIAVAAGGLLNLAGGPPPGTLSQSVDQLIALLGGAGLPLGLMAVGAALQPRLIASHARAIAVSTVFKLIALPALAVTLAISFGVSGPPLIVAILFAGVPTSASSFILARQMGGDHTMLAGLLTAETVVAFLTLPLWIIAFSP